LASILYIIMKYQALILIFVILISLSVFHQTNVFSESQVVGGSDKTASISVLNSGEKTVSSDTDEKQSDTVNQTNNSSLSLSAVIEGHSVLKEETVENICLPLQTNIFLVKNLEDGKVVLENRSASRWPIASITKLMTALIALENMNLSSIIEISPSAFEKSAGSDFLSSGGKYSVENLIKASLIFSSNEAAYALTEGFGYEGFVSKMNQKAKELGMSQSFFEEPTGLSYLNQSNLSDLSLLMGYIYRNKPLIFDISRRSRISIREESSGKVKSFNNINLFAGQSDFFGGKTGFIDASGGNLVTLFEKGGKMFFIGVFSSGDRFGDVEKLLECIGQ